MRIATLLAVVAWCCCWPAACQEKPLAGGWKLAMPMADGTTRDAFLNIVVAADGTFTGEMNAGKPEQVLKGKVSGNSFVFSIERKTFSGTVSTLWTGSWTGDVVTLVVDGKMVSGVRFDRPKKRSKS